ncbi:MAG: hypothetical protein P1R58_04710 [bacterium]|nr:hypothetical protein [bacterium]
MSSLWQYIGVGLILLAAAVYLVYHYTNKRSSNQVCDHCPVRPGQTKPLLHKTRKSD